MTFLLENLNKRKKIRLSLEETVKPGIVAFNGIIGTIPAFDILAIFIKNIPAGDLVHPLFFEVLPESLPFLNGCSIGTFL